MSTSAPAGRPATLTQRTLTKPPLQRFIGQAVVAADPGQQLRPSGSDAAGTIQDADLPAGQRDGARPEVAELKPGERGIEGRAGCAPILGLVSGFHRKRSRKKYQSRHPCRHEFLSTQIP